MTEDIIETAHGVYFGSEGAAMSGNQLLFWGIFLGFCLLCLAIALGAHWVILRRRVRRKRAVRKSAGKRTRGRKKRRK